MMLQGTKDGSHTLISGVFGEAYHSLHGAVTESDHVFIGAGLREAMQQKKDLSVLETGFGTGLNAFMTWLEAEKNGLDIQYTGLEYYPVGAQTAAGLNYPDLLGVPERKSDFMRLHELSWNESHPVSPHFIFEKRLALIQEFQSAPIFDLIYFDAFAPQAQPELWTQEVMERMFQALRPGGILVTYCAQGAFKRHLKAAGFAVERLPGPPGKREITRAKRSF